ncbi:hypothetical protein M513_09375 [Trichuris suis]|uniref:RNA-directed DNA polymerase n=1 Tax=Trichuris suis TaxID=68888 RepID=A0A085LXT4_9BILA|nr:hypothetical protein M513_09375 [Trichuris suis]
MTGANHFEPFAPQKGASWSLYIERLNFHFEAHDVKDDAKKRGILLSVCGNSTYALIQSVIRPKLPNELSYEQITTAMKQYFNPEPSEIVERFRFYKRDQRPNESISDFVAELRRLSEHCNFGNGVDTVLRDRFVCGISDEELQRRLLAEQVATFDAAVKEALATETARLESIEIRTGQAISDIQQIRTKPHKRKPREKETGSGQETERPTGCHRCGGQHDARTCRFKNERCRYCQKFGHIERACRKKSQERGVGDQGTRRRGRKTPDRVQLHAVTEQDESFVSNQGQETYFLNTVTSDMKNPIVANVLINGKPLAMEVDSGSACSLINERVFRQLNLTSARQTYPAKVLRTWSKEQLDVRSQVEVEVQYNGCKCRLPLVVVNGAGGSLLGRDWFEPLGISVLGIHQVQAAQAESLLSRYAAVFSEDINAYKGPPVSIELEQGVPPKFLKCRPVPFAIRAKLDDALDNLVNQGILKPVRHSKWATPIVPVLKRNGELRVCGDYRATVNASTKKDTYPSPTVTELMAASESTMKLLTLNTPKGLMQMTRLPFGVDVAPSIFQRFMDTCMAGLEGVKAYLDDVLITGRSEEEHWKRVEDVLARLSEVGVRLRRDKCIFGVKEVEYLGFRIDSQGVHPTAEKVEAIQKAPSPTNKTELQAFLGLLNFYSFFLPGKAEVLEPLHRLLGNKSIFVWQEQHEQAFRRAKELLLSSKVLVHYDPRKKLTVTCDASQHGVGAILSQPDSKGKEAPVAYASRTLSKPERNYAQIDKEALAIIYAVKKFHQYLYGRPFTIITDHKPLLGLLHPHKALPQVMSPRMLRWSLMLAAYDYELRISPGVKVANADGLSRLPIPSPEMEIPPPGDIFLLETDVETPVDAKTIEKLTRRDKTLSQVLHWALRGWPATKQADVFQSFIQRKSEISVHRNCLLWGNRVIIPEKAKTKVLELLHEAHPGMVRMKTLARSYVWWPRLGDDIEDTVKGCTVCQETQNAPKRAPMNPWERTETPWSRLHLDFAGLFQGQIFLIVVDSYSKWLDVIPVSTASANAVIEKLALLFATHGLPDVIVTDNGTAFTSFEFKQFAKANTIRHVTVAPYHPSSNGQAERMVQTVKRSLKKIIHGSWNIRLARFLFNQHLIPHTATGSSPAEMLMSRRPRSLLDNLHPDSMHARHSRQDHQERCAASAEQTRRFTAGDSVYMRSYKEGEKWIPASITGVTGPRSYTLRTSGGVNERRHIDQIRGRSLETNGDPSTEETSDKESPDRDKGEHDDTEQHSTETPECSRSPEPDTSKDVTEDRPQRHRTRPKYLDDYV